jgi:hypothetical protein
MYNHRWLDQCLTSRDMPECRDDIKSLMGSKQGQGQRIHYHSYPNALVSISMDLWYPIMSIVILALRRRPRGLWFHECCMQADFKAAYLRDTMFIWWKWVQSDCWIRQISTGSARNWGKWIPQCRWDDGAMLWLLMSFFDDGDKTPNYDSILWGRMIGCSGRFRRPVRGVFASWLFCTWSGVSVSVRSKVDNL